MQEEATKTPQRIFLCSSIMRSPQVFDQYGPTVGGLARDLAIWIAWNRAKNAGNEAQLNVKQFREMFGYSHGFLFKPVTPEQKEWLKAKQFGKEFKDLLGFTLAKMYIEKLNFPSAAQYSAENEGGVRVDYTGINLIGAVSTVTTKRGTSYFFKVSKSFLNNCEKWYREFDLNEYLAIVATNGRAWSSGRRTFLHLAWKRTSWDQAPAKNSWKYEVSQYDELLAVAGFNYASDKRTAHQLRQLLEDIGTMPRVAMIPEVTHQLESDSYKVKFTKVKEAKAVEKH